MQVAKKERKNAVNALVEDLIASISPRKTREKLECNLTYRTRCN